MVLEILAEERLNIKNLCLFQPEGWSVRPFNPDRDITRKDWQGIESLLKHYQSRPQNQEETERFTLAAADIFLLSNTGLKEIDLVSLYPEDFMERSKELASVPIGEKLHWKNFLWIDHARKILFPDLGLQMNTEHNWEETKGLLMGYYYMWLGDDETKDFPAVFHTASAKIIFPERFAELNIERELPRSWIKQVITRFSQLDHMWEEYVELMANARIIFPDIIQDFQIDEFFWKRMKNNLNQLRTFLGPSFLSVARSLKILAAKGVQVTDKGLQIDMGELVPNVIPEVPRIRIF